MRRRQEDRGLRRSAHGRVRTKPRRGRRGEGLVVRSAAERVGGQVVVCFREVRGAWWGKPHVRRADATTGGRCPRSR